MTDVARRNLRAPGAGAPRPIAPALLARARQARQLRAPWHGPKLRTLTVPTLVLHGDADPVGRPSAARAIARQVPHARLVILPGVGHELPRPLWPTLVGHLTDNADRARVPAG